MGGVASSDHVVVRVAWPHVLGRRSSELARHFDELNAVKVSPHELHTEGPHVVSLQKL